MDFNTLTNDFRAYLPSILQALLILLIGLLIAYILSAVVRAVLTRFNVDDRLNSRLAPQRFDLSNLVASAVFWIVFLFAIVAALERLSLPAFALPLNNFLGQVTAYLPNLIGGIILIAVAFLIATLVKRLVEGVVRGANLDNRLRQRTDTRVSLTDSLGTLAYYLVWLLFLPAILETLGLYGLLAPVQGLVTQIVSFLPNLFSAAIIIIVGYFVARIVRDIVVNLLATTGIDNLGARMGMGTDTPGGSSLTLSKLVGTLVFALILIPVVITGLDALQLEALSAPAISMLNRLLAAIPNIFAAGILLVITYFVGRLVADLVKNLLAGVGFDRVLTNLGLRTSAPGGRQPSDIVGTVVLVAIMLFAVAEAAALLGFDQLSALTTQLLIFFGNVVLGLIVLALGLYIATLADRTIRQSNVQNAGFLALVARVAIIALALAMALRQMGIAEDLIVLTFGLILGALAVAAAIAFGIGGRDVAKREVERFADALREGSDSLPGNNEPPPPDPADVLREAGAGAGTAGTTTVITPRPEVEVFNDPNDSDDPATGPTRRPRNR